MVVYMILTDGQLRSIDTTSTYVLRPRCNNPIVIPCCFKPLLFLMSEIFTTAVALLCYDLLRSIGTVTISGLQRRSFDLVVVVYAPCIFGYITN